MIVKNFKKKIFKLQINKKRFLFFFIIFCCLALYSFYLIYVGAKLQKNQTAAHFKELIHDLKRENISFIENYLKSLSSKPDVLYLDMDFKNVMKLENARDSALKRGFISQEDQSIVSKAEIRKNNEIYKVDISPTGFLLDMIGDKKKRAYKVKVKKNSTIYSMSEFKLLPPKSRFYLTELIGQNLAKKEGLISINYFFINLFFNGDDLGIYAVEEHLTKELIEKNNKRNGIIFSYNQDTGKIKIFNEKKYLKNGEFNKEQINFIKSIWNGSINNPKKILDHINIDKFSRYFAIIDLMDGFHALENNSLFYLDPISLTIEPILREFNSYRYVDGPPSYDWISINQFSKVKNNSSFYKKFYSELFNNSDFLNNYVKNLEKLSNKTYLDNFFKNNKKKFKKQLSYIHKSYPTYNFPEEYIYLKQDQIRKHLSQKKILLSKINSNNIIELENLSKYPLKIIKIENKKINYIKEYEKLIIYPNKIKFTKIDNSISDSFEFDNNFEIFYEINNLKKSYLNINPISKNLEKIKINYSFDEDKNLEEFFFIDYKSKIIRPKNKKLIVNKNIFFPKDYKVVFSKNTKIDLIDNSRIISRSSFEVNGEKNAQVLFTSSDNSSSGILIHDSKEKNIFKYTSFTNFNNTLRKNINTLGVINIYNTNVIFDNCLFKDNKSEDALNIINSKFKIYDSKFIQATSDSLDLDFSEGLIENVSFIKSKNDALDMSGGKVKIKNIFITEAGDKAISSGEKNVLIGDNIILKNNAIGIASKDLSNISLNNILFENNNLAITAYQKKKAYGPAKIYLYDTKLIKNNKDFLIEEKSKLFLNDNEVKIKKYNDVEDLMYGNVFGTKTEK
jgi:hypothetical protein